MISQRYLEIVGKVGGSVVNIKEIEELEFGSLWYLSQEMELSASQTMSAHVMCAIASKAVKVLKISGLGIH